MDFTINNYRAKKFGAKYFVTTDHGSYCVLSEKEFKKLKKSVRKFLIHQKILRKRLICGVMMFC